MEEMIKTKEISIGHLACIGDAIYELKIREYFVLQKKLKINDINKEKIKYVSAKNQELILDSLINRQILNEEELYTIFRARNYKPASKPNNVSIVTYKKATALESLFGMLYLENNITRINYLIEKIVGESYDS